MITCKIKICYASKRREEEKKKEKTSKKKCLKIGRETLFSLGIVFGT